jgi:pimeloyl-ACP methyl ester carboxylesterase
VLLHGIGSNSKSWRRQLAGLKEHFGMMAWDAPGYGGSSDPPAPPAKPSMHFYAESLRALLDSLKLDHVFLLGHSMGGIVAQEFYRAYPDYVRALILADTRCEPTLAGFEDRLRSIRSMTPAQLAAERAPALLSSNASPDLVREVVSIMSEVRPPGYEYAATAMAESDTRGVVNHVAVPLLLIWGTEDKITPVWEELPARAQSALIPNAGHLCYSEQPERFNEIVTKFLLSNL